MKPTNEPPSRLKLLFADDEKSLQELMRLELPRMGHRVTVCPDGLTAVAALERNTYDCILVDLDMPGLNGIEVIGRCKRLAPETEAIVLTGKSSMESAVAALRFGAFDYLTKPCKLIELEALLNRVAEKRQLTKKYLALKQRLQRLEGTSDLIGDSPAMTRVRQLLAKVAPTDSTVMILGETGTGKELVARALHDQSLRADKPLVPINCGALPENLIESELFGHRKGSFTGADENRVGLVEVADGGTLFLDEIGELPKPMQAKLLRFLENGEVRRVGENESFRCNVRVVCATHCHLDEMVRQGKFREDLWYRINTFEIHLPPLRDRADDVLLLARHLAARYHPHLPADAQVFSPAAADLLRSYPWPGNVRELANVIEHAIILADTLPLSREHFPSRFANRLVPREKVRTGPPRTLRQIELLAIEDALQRHQGSKPKAAEELGIGLKTLYNKLNQAAALSKSA